MSDDSYAALIPGNNEFLFNARNMMSEITNAQACLDNNYRKTRDVLEDVERRAKSLFWKRQYNTGILMYAIIIGVDTLASLPLEPGNASKSAKLFDVGGIIGGAAIASKAANDRKKQNCVVRELHAAIAGAPSTQFFLAADVDLSKTLDQGMQRSNMTAVLDMGRTTFVLGAAIATLALGQHVPQPLTSLGTAVALGVATLPIEQRHSRRTKQTMHAAIKAAREINYEHYRTQMSLARPSAA